MNDAMMRARKAVEANPDNELARFTLGKCLFDLGQHSEAREHLAAATAQKPEWMAAQILLARCHLGLDDQGAARPVLEQARQLAQKQGHVGPLAQVEELIRQLDR